MSNEQVEKFAARRLVFAIAWALVGDARVRHFIADLLINDRVLSAKSLVLSFGDLAVSRSPPRATAM
jgi:hypothetical protein